MIKTDILIIGAGLTGLTLAYLLRNSDRKVVITEARDRTGGRIYTKGGDDKTTVEMGATWLGPAHTKLRSLLKEINITSFKQKLGSKAIYEPNSMNPHQLVSLPKEQQESYRIAGGTMTLIDALADERGNADLLLNERVLKVTVRKETLIVETNKDSYEALKVVSTLPPKLLSDTIQISPMLPDPLTNILRSTHTWMGESIKFGLTYEDPFWQKDNSSGTLFSNVGPVNEMYDHSSKDRNRYALKGFLNNSYFSLSEEERLQMILDQLRKYYGEAVDNYLEYHEMVWADETYTYSPYTEHVLPHQHNGHAVFQASYFNNRFFVAGAETSQVSPGYMDGAVYSAQKVFEMIG
ncbi:MAG TPA: NAD(P)/FAD-dependent oxidoreductase [Gracilimonas sp.]|nr:NAD(P)/FAD-dependent oxidoreductase [Gracilimonas sp.]